LINNNNNKKAHALAMLVGEHIKLLFRLGYQCAETVVSWEAAVLDLRGNV
jgi:hypothetical protein